MPCRCGAAWAAKPTGQWYYDASSSDERNACMWLGSDLMGRQRPQKQQKSWGKVMMERKYCRSLYRGEPGIGSEVTK